MSMVRIRDASLQLMLWQERQEQVIVSPTPKSARKPKKVKKIKHKTQKVFSNQGDDGPNSEHTSSSESDLDPMFSSS